MNLACVTTYDPEMQFGGVANHMTRSLLYQGVDIQYVGPLQMQYSPSTWARELVCRVLLKKNFNAGRHPAVVKNYSMEAARRLKNQDVDIVFSPQSPASQPIAYLDIEKPIVIWTDATFAGVIGFYSAFSSLARKEIRDGMANEKAALEKCSLAIYTSDWAARTAIENYGIAPEKVKVVPYGPSMDTDRSKESILASIDSRPGDKCRLLCVATNWVRKGGSLVVKVAEELNRSGLETEVMVIGCKRRVMGKIPEYVKSLGYIDKQTEAGKKELEKLYRESHFLILPTQADCTPVAISEACSFALPSLTSNVGGIPSTITDGLNGMKFDRSAGPNEYGDYIIDLFTDFARYRKLALSTFEQYEAKLNWNVAGKRVRDMMFELL